MYVSRDYGKHGTHGPADENPQARGSAQPQEPDQPVAGDCQRVFLDLLEPIYPKALGYAQTITGSLMDGEDLVSDTVLAAYTRFQTLRDRDRFKEWFFAILLNRFRNQRSRQKLRPLTLVAEPSGSHYFWEATIRVSGDPAELGYQLALVKELLGRLKPRERELLLLLGPAELSPEEVARMQKTSVRAVIQRAYRARRKLAKLLPAGAGLPLMRTKANEVTGNE